MDHPAGSDKSLLDRLNALKATSVDLEPPLKPVFASTIEPAKSTSRDDALSDRLKSLRSQSGSPIPTATTQPRTSADPDIRESGQDFGSTVVPGSTGVDPLLDTDEQTLEELLAELGSDDQWLEEAAAEFTADEEHRRVTALLEELGTTSPDHASLDNTAPHPHDADGSSDEDDSDGEPMTQEADDILAQAIDETEYEKAYSPGAEPRPTLPLFSGVGLKYADSFNLPAVPSELQDQPDLPDPSQADDFEADITSRMAALKGLGSSGRTLPSAPTSQVDDLGLPVAPTFAPEDRPLKGVYKRCGYTDEDQRTWCIVCLEDGAIHCLGCDDDIYCARCWKEMHVGPRAGYEERGHSWEKFVRDR
ncbi:uncharacterized protein BCR38DRAFT_462238 [Pseudomassariella vexata]|uniref:Uncharacterized protein n=1 Tax=Pseudomassariella vexata TaxID=1141098 RepID=A0A1Y2D5M4_9PEZI|nr:uncharacterized protein BCR38DRAFT_462238 [Pseudomassariella vexata]ORY54581.1 hypothetical protein BCR38DRAFT_462238 [Pseudomassariella vexata]